MNYFFKQGAIPLAPSLKTEEKVQYQDPSPAMEEENNISPYSIVPVAIQLSDLPPSELRPTLDRQAHKVSLSFSEGQIVFTLGFKDAQLANDENFDYALKKIASYCLIPMAKDLWQGIYLKKLKTDPQVQATKTLNISVTVDPHMDGEGEYSHGKIFLKNPKIIYRYLQHESIHCDQNDEMPDFQDVRKHPNLTSLITTVALLEAEAELRSNPLKYLEPEDGAPLFSDAPLLLLQSTPSAYLSARPDYVSYFDAHMRPGSHWYESYKSGLIKGAYTAKKDSFAPEDNGYLAKAKKRLGALGLRSDQIDILQGMATDAIQTALDCIANPPTEEKYVVYSYIPPVISPLTDSRSQKPKQMEISNRVTYRYNPSPLNIE